MVPAMVIAVDRAVSGCMQTIQGWEQPPAEDVETAVSLKSAQFGAGGVRF
jgi:hypothetical protein